MSEERILDTRRRVWLATPGWKIYAGDGLTPPNIDNLTEMKQREMTCLSYPMGPCIANLDPDNPNDMAFEIVLPSPKVTESHAKIGNVLSKYSRSGQEVTLDFDPQFLYGYNTSRGIGTVRYKSYLSFTSLPQYLGQAFLSFLDLACGQYIYMLTVDKLEWIFIYTDNSILLSNSGRNEFMDISLEIERWGLNNEDSRLG